MNSKNFDAENMKYILMIAPNNFPEGDAGAVRDSYFAKIYQELGYKIIHIGMNPKTENGEWYGVRFYSLYKKNNGLLNKLKNNLSYGCRLNKLFGEIKKIYGIPSIIHIYDIPEKGILWAVKKAKELNIPILHDSVEWYSASQFSMGYLSYPYILKNRTNKKLIKKPISVIAISTYLEKYFKGKGLATIRVPVIMDSNDYHGRARIDDRKIHMVYAGSPYKKDYLVECIKAFCNLPLDTQERFVFHIFGVDRDFVKKKCNETIPESITVHGRVSRDEVIHYLENSDFSILLRPENMRYTKAGFPTKVVEAMMNGCAMICNLTSDLGMYLKNGENAVLVEGCSVEAMERALANVAKMDNQKLKLLKDNARHTAETSFDYRKFIEEIKTFIDDIS